MSPILSRAGFSFGFGKRKVSSGPSGPFSATGGTTATPGDGYRYHFFTTTGPNPFNVTGTPSTISNLLVVAAGGYGGNSRAGGGGAGGVRNLSSIPVTVQDYTITVGADGPGQGGPSDAIGYSATGGGAMPSNTNAPGGGPLGPGGSGCGGPGDQAYPGGTGNIGGHSPPEGNPGGVGSGAIGGGGGGAGGAGPAAPGPYPNPGVQGANGVLVPWVPASYGESGRFAAGGSSTGYPGITAPPGNTNGGGGGGNRTALANTGGGGGGSPNGAQGGSGVVILRYVYP